MADIFKARNSLHQWGYFPMYYPTPYALGMIRLYSEYPISNIKFAKIIEDNTQEARIEEDEQ